MIQVWAIGAAAPEPWEQAKIGTNDSWSVRTAGNFQVFTARMALMESSRVPSRRSLLTVSAAAGTVGVLAGCSPFQNLVGDKSGEPAAIGAEGTPVRAGKLSEVPVGGSANMEVEGKPILIHRPDEETVLAYSAECTHQGCKVAATESEIACPCHNSTFALTDGAVTGGPAPAPLPRFAAAIDGDWITVVV